MKQYFQALLMTREAFAGKKRELWFWILFRGLSLALSPIVFPITINLLFNALEMGDSVYSLKICCLIVVYILPIYAVNYLICYYSDAWVIDCVYSWMNTCIKKVVELPHDKVIREYEIGNLQNCVISGAWAVIQAWVHLFRLFAPIVSLLIMALFVMKYSIFMAAFVFVAILFDYLLCEIEAKQRHLLNEKIVESNVKRESKLGELIKKMEYICITDSYSIMMDEYRDVQKQLWENQKRNMICTVIVDCINEIYERTLTGLLSLLLMSLKINDLVSVGAIGAANTLFGNFRERVKYVKSQVESTVSKVKPINRLKNLFDIQETASYLFLNNNCNTSNSLISLRDVSYQVENREIIKSINLEIRQCEKIAIIGKNGSGKSTILKVINGINTLSSGEIWFTSDIIQDMKSYKQVGGAYAPAENSLFYNSSVRTNILMGVNDVAEEKSTFLSEFELTDLLDEKVGNISGGQAQRVNLNRCIVKNALIYFMDEPTASLDSALATKVFESIVKNIQGALIYVTHNPDLLTYADRIVIVDEGRIVFDGNYDNCKECEYYKRWKYYVK